jgi:hypothetical protein
MTDGRSTAARSAGAGPARRTVQVLWLGGLYFVIVFGVGFLLGPVRVLWLEPRVGARTAELIEAPIMLAAIVLAGRWAYHRARAQGVAVSLPGVGVVAAALVLLADLAVGLGLRGMTPLQVVVGRDPVSGIVYYGLIGLLALMPWLHGQLAARR